MEGKNIYRLKETIPEFTVVDGPFANRTYRHGENYSEVPPQEAHKFDEGAGLRAQGSRSKGQEAGSEKPVGK